MMNLTAQNMDGKLFDIVASNRPTLEFEEIPVIIVNNTIAYMLGSSKFLPIESVDILPDELYGVKFNMFNDEWNVENCYVMADKKHIYYKHAQMKV